LETITITIGFQHCTLESLITYKSQYTQRWVCIYSESRCCKQKYSRKDYQLYFCSTNDVERI